MKYLQFIRYNFIKIHILLDLVSIMLLRERSVLSLIYLQVNVVKYQVFFFFFFIKLKYSINFLEIKYCFSHVHTVKCFQLSFLQMNVRNRLIEHLKSINSTSGT